MSGNGSKRVNVQEVARRAGVSRPAVWHWQQRFAQEGVEGLLRDKTRPPMYPTAFHPGGRGGGGADLFGAA